MSSPGNAHVYSALAQPYTIPSACQLDLHTRTHARTHAHARARTQQQHSLPIQSKAIQTVTQDLICPSQDLVSERWDHPNKYCTLHVYYTCTPRVKRIARVSY